MNYRIRKSYLIMLHDLFVVEFSFLLALFLRLGSEIDYAVSVFLPGTLVLIPLSILCFRMCHIPQRVWEYTSVQDLNALIRAVTLTILGLFVVLFIYNRLEGMPRSAFFIQWFVTLGLLTAPRLLYRMVRNKKMSLRLVSLPQRQKVTVLLVGINDTSEAFLRDTVGNPQSDYRVVGLIDTTGKQQGRVIRNVKVYGSLLHLEKVLKKLQLKGKAPQKLVIAPDVMSGDEIKSLLELAETHGLTLSRLPRLTDFRQTTGETMSLRPIMVEDLLGRPQRSLDKSLLQTLIEGKAVLVTGAGGTIGGELTRQILHYKPSKLIIVEHSELALYEITQDIQSLKLDIPHEGYLSDIRNVSALDYIFTQSKPEVVFHAAALKHVPLSEENISQAVMTNVFGTKNLAEQCVKHTVSNMIMISTDKAVNPTSVMGATKRCAEIYLQGLQESGQCSTQFTNIRFGNVLGSTGSVVPLFRKQLEKGGPLTVTDPKMQRYFMTVREAVELVLYAASLVHNKQLDSKKIFVLDMGSPVFIKDLAEQMIRLAGLVPNKDIHIEYSGLRPGEKLFEELFHGKEAPLKTDFDGILIAQTRAEKLSALEKKFKSLLKHAEQHQHDDCKTLLKEIVPEYT